MIETSHRLKFSNQQRFLWGVTHIGSQTESVCAASDWAHACASGRQPEIGRGLEYLENYRDHHDQAEDLGVGAFRLTVEWARVEPREGEFDAEAIAKYRGILRDLKDRNITTTVGLFHYVSPQWFSESYGWHHSYCTTAFARFARRVMMELGDLIDVVVVHNEPMLFISLGYVRGARPPFRKNVLCAALALYNVIATQKLVYKMWKDHFPDIPVGSAHLWNAITVCEKSDFKKRLLKGTFLRFCERISYFYRVGFIAWCMRNVSDYTGLNYYTSNSFYLGKSRVSGRWGHLLHETNNWHDPDVWQGFAAGLRGVLAQAKKFGKPIIILENGKPSLSGPHDDDRQVFLAAHTDIVKDLRASYDIVGYFHHSLMDCYEWDSGYDFKFGLIEVDRATLEQTKRKSYDVYRLIIERS